MPRAKPSRSGYCASRHLLRNLDDARELRRNELAAAYFVSSSRSRRRTPDADRRSLEQICGLVREALGTLYADNEDDRDGARLGRMHAALLRCEIDRQPPELVASELGLSERQLRRERSTAHDAFLRAFRRVAGGERAPAIVGADIAQLRLAEAVELHAIGKSSLGLAVFASMAQTAPNLATRVEACCLAAEAEFDAGRLPEARSLVATVHDMLALHGNRLDEPEQAAFAEHVEFLEWCSRWQSGIGAGVAMRPPSIVTDPSSQNLGSERRRALRVRALAAYAGQRWEVGDVPQGREAVRVAYGLLLSLARSRVKERLAVMQVDAQLYALRGAFADEGYPRLLAVEELAARSGHLRPLFAARAERLGTETERTRPVGRTFDDVLAELGTAERGSMDRTVAHVACIAAQWERDPRRAMQAADVGAALVSPGTATGLLVRTMRARRALAHGRYIEARQIAESVQVAAAQTGNSRVRAAAERDLAMVALGEGRQRDARRIVRSALPALERYGSRIAFADALRVARRLGVH